MQLLTKINVSPNNPRYKLYENKFIIGKSSMIEKDNFDVLVQSNCTKCKNGSFLYNNKCNQECLNGYVGVSNVCQRCESPCSSCEETQNKCTSCIENYFLEGNTCTDKCQKGLIGLNGKCEECSSDCETCITSQSTCASCKENQFLYNGQCIPNCPDGYSGIEGECLQCESSCSKCSTATTTCTECKSGYFLYKDTCILNCPTGYYGSSRKCIECSNTCKTCTDTPTTCTSCYDGSLLDGNECKQTCQDGYSPINDKCDQCTSNCAQCKGTVSTCTSCITNFHLFGEECLPSCPTGYTSIDGKCEKCTYPCSECAGSQTTCTLCSDNKYLYEDGCVDSCPQGTMNEGFRCLKCDSSCKECQGSIDQCITCLDGYYQLENRCYSSCSQANDYESLIYYGNNNKTFTCERCIESGCVDCSSNYLVCSACDSQHVVEFGECYPPDYVVLVETNCSEIERCNYSVYKMKSVQVVVLVSSFTNKDQQLEGGAFYITDCAVSCENTSFINCTSHGGGGAIYIKNSKELSNDINLTSLVFFKCKANYGGAVYIYSSYIENNITVYDCKFYSNEIKSDYIDDKDPNLCGGSAFFLSSQKCDIQKCIFENNKGKKGAFKIYMNFDKLEKANKLKKMDEIESDNLLSISNCEIKMRPKDESGIFIEGKETGKIEIVECGFSGKLGKDAKYIGGRLNLKNSEKVQVRNCQFEYEDKSSVRIELLKDEDN